MARALDLETTAELHRRLARVLARLGHTLGPPAGEDADLGSASADAADAELIAKVLRHRESL